MLKHKDGKTFKFIIRNLYFLMTLVVDEADEKPATVLSVDQKQPKDKEF